MVNITNLIFFYYISHINNNIMNDNNSNNMDNNTMSGKDNNSSSNTNIISNNISNHSTHRKNNKSTYGRCAQCNKKLKIIHFTCKCNLKFCISHKNPHSHNCQYDNTNNNKLKLIQSNPKIIHNKVITI